MYQLSTIRKTSIIPIVLAIALTVLGIKGQTKIDAEINSLMLNQLFERQTKGGETHAFQVELKKGEYARAVR